MKLANPDQEKQEDVDEAQEGENEENEDQGATKYFARLKQQITDGKDFQADTWVMHNFHHPSRLEKDSIFHHWTKSKECNEPYPFAKFNKQPDVLDFTEKEYKDG